MQNREEYIKQIINLIDSAIEGTLYCAQSLQLGKVNECAKILEVVKEVALSYDVQVNDLKVYLQSKYIAEIGENIVSSIDEFFREYNSGKIDKLQLLIEYTLLQLFRELREEIYFFGLIYPDKEKMTVFYKDEFCIAQKNDYIEHAMHIEEYKYPLTIAVLAYNKLEYTKQCVEAILKYSNGYEYELILVNHGSSDGTREYFESIMHKNKKVINFKINMGGLIASNIMSRIYEGKYIFSVNNDVIVTENWIGNLLKCIQSDEKIGVVVPTTNAISNNQAISVPYNNIDEMQVFAKEYNVSDSSKWQERERLMPMMSCVRSELFGGGMSSDRLFQYTEFCDDDFFLRLRLMGHKAILAKDTFVHHYGSVTLGEAQEQENTLVESRDVFKLKHGFDAWYNVESSRYICSEIQFSQKGNIDILCIDPAFGATPYRIRNEYIENGNKNIKLYNFTTQKDFADVLNISFDEFILGKDTTDVTTSYQHRMFDYVVFCCALEEYNNIEEILTGIKTLLKLEGRLIFYINNVFDAMNIYYLLTLNERFFDDRLHNHFMSYTKTYEFLSNMGYSDINITAFDAVSQGQLLSVINQAMQAFGINKNDQAIDLHKKAVLVFSAGV